MPRGTKRNGKSGPPGNMNAFKYGPAAIQKRREEDITTEHEESVRQQILDGLMIGLIDVSAKSRKIDKFNAARYHACTFFMNAS